MRTSLEKLAHYLKASNLPSEERQVKHLLKEALYPKAEIILKLFQNPKYEAYFIRLLRGAGFIPEQESLISLMTAADYLKEGITDNNLLLAGFSLISIIPGLENVAKLINNTNPDPELVIETSKLIIRNQGTIQGALNRIRDPKFGSPIKYYIPGGNLLVDYSDRIWNTVNNWALKQKDLTAATTGTA